MRELATPTDAHDAKILIDYLLTQKITAEIRLEDGKSVVWVHNEDDMPRAREIWDEFRTQPKDSKYIAAQKPAQELRKLKAKVEKNYAKLYFDADHFWGRPHPSRVPFTVVLIILSVFVSAWTEFGGNAQNLYKLTFAVPVNEPFAMILDPDPAEKQRLKDDVRSMQLKPIKRGEYWRLITPIFLHFTWYHLFFNMYALYSLGGIIENRRGLFWTLLFVFVTGVFSNAMQFLYPTIFDLQAHKGLALSVATFGGMSGVCYALFGYLAAKTLYAPEPGLHIPRDVIISMLVWLAICMTGWIGSIANTAHVAGLVIGFAIGVLPRVWKIMRQRV